MSVRNLSLPEHYFSKLDIMETEIAIKLAKDTFERELARCLELTRVSAPLFVQPETGLNDDLNGVERPVQSISSTSAPTCRSSTRWRNGSVSRSRATASRPAPGFTPI